ncbi:MAG: hypothetical protein ABFD92_16190 [Planctomycetaceae bacterium]|nr:hypothetical protein [Planctomycetaceae bacterium]
MSANNPGSIPPPAPVVYSAQNYRDGLGRPTQTRAERLAKLRKVGLVMLAIMATVLAVAGALGSIKWNNALTEMLYPSQGQRFGGAALNLSSGLIFWIALIGVYLPARWGLKLNIIGCLWYLVGTILLEAFDPGKIVWSESISDIVFWGTFPIIQIVCLVIGSSHNPTLVGGDDNAQPSQA